MAQDATHQGGVILDADVHQGWTRALFAYDVAHSIDLDGAGRLVGAAAGRDGLRSGRKGPSHFQFQPARLRLVDGAEPLELAGFRAEPRVDIVLFDFGAASVEYTFPTAGPMRRILDLGGALYENKELRDDSRRRLERLCETLCAAMVRPGVAAPVEDYVVHWVDRLGDAAAPPQETIRAARADLARLLRCERDELSAQEVEDAVARIVSYGGDDAAVIDWNAALLVGPEPDAELAILEYANVELLEMRLLDDQLDAALERAYAAVQRERRLLGILRVDHDLREVARMQMDSALLFEGVNNALKLLGDQYLARLYRAASERLHLPSWDANILRKLGVLESIYQKMSDAKSTLRMEILEWIIIVLIAISLIMPFVITGK